MENNDRLVEMILHLQEERKQLEAEINRLHSVIAPLKEANKQKDEFMAALVDDLAKAQQQEARWEKFAHRALEEQKRLHEQLEVATLRP